MCISGGKCFVLKRMDKEKSVKPWLTFRLNPSSIVCRDTLPFRENKKYCWRWFNRAKAAHIPELTESLMSLERGNRNYKWPTPAALLIWILFFQACGHHLKFQFHLYQTKVFCQGTICSNEIPIQFLTQTKPNENYTSKTATWKHTTSKYPTIYLLIFTPCIKCPLGRFGTTTSSKHKRETIWKRLRALHP